MLPVHSVIQPGHRIPFMSGEFMFGGARVDDSCLAAVWREISAIANRSVTRRHRPRAAQLSSEIVKYGVARVDSRGSQSVKEDVLAADVSGKIALRVCLALEAAPVYCPIRFLYAKVTTIVHVVHACCGREPVFRVIGEGIDAVAGHVSRQVVAEAGELIVRRRHAQGRRGALSHGNREQIGPAVISETLTPAVGAGSCLSLCGRDPVQRIVRNTNPAPTIQTVDDGRQLSVVTR